MSQKRERNEKKKSLDRKKVLEAERDGFLNEFGFFYFLCFVFYISVCKWLFMLTRWLMKVTYGLAV